MSVDFVLDWLNAHRTLVGWMVIGSAILFVASVIAVPWMLVRIPHDYFGPGTHHTTPFADHHPVARLVLLVARNLIGTILLLAGIAMLVLPGQGILTILAGLVLLHFPRKHELLRWILSRRQVLASANWVRHRARRPPLIV